MYQFVEHFSPQYACFYFLFFIITRLFCVRCLLKVYLFEFFNLKIFSKSIVGPLQILLQSKEPVMEAEVQLLSPE